MIDTRKHGATVPKSRNKWSKQTCALTNKQEEIQKLSELIATQANDERQLKKEHDDLGAKLAELKRAADEFKQHAQRLGFEAALVPRVHPESEDVARPKSLLRFADSIANKIATLTTDLNRITADRAQVKELQDAIASRSGKFETQQIYFSEPETEWELLVESLDSLPQLEDANTKSGMLCS